MILALAACGTTAQPVAEERPGVRVAAVDGESILVRDVEDWMRMHDVSAQEALDALVDEALLVAEARRRGVTPSRSVLRRAMAQEVLDGIERAVPNESVTLDAVRAEYDATVERMASTPDVVVPPLEDSIDEIRTMLAGRQRFARLEVLLEREAPQLNEERVSALLAMPEFD